MWARKKREENEKQSLKRFGKESSRDWGDLGQHGTKINLCSFSLMSYTDVMLETFLKMYISFLTFNRLNLIFMA